MGRFHQFHHRVDHFAGAYLPGPAHGLAGLDVAMTDPLGHATTTAYDSLNRAVTITDALGGTVALAYDAAGRQTQVTDPVGNVTATTYDTADRPTAVTDALGSASYSYDADDELTDKTDQNGRRTAYAYDNAGRRTQERWLDGSGATLRTVAYAYTYDAADQLTGVTGPDATLTFSYDAAGQVLTAGTSSTAGQPAVTLTTTYDQAGRRKTLTDNLASVGQTSYTYDNASRLTTLSRTVGGAAGPKVEFGYDIADRLTSLRRTNGTSGGGLGGLEGGGGGSGGTGSAITTTLGYDAADRLTTLSHQVEGGATLATYAYVYDAADRVTSETNAEGTVNFTYDVANQLTGASGSRTESYGYDLSGNRNTTGYTTTAGNLMTASPGATYTYDAEGNRIGKTDTATGNTTAYVYDYRNRLTGVTERNSSGALLHQVTYTYDALDRRIGVNTDGTQTWTVYDGQNTYADFNSGGSLTTRYLYGPAVDELLARTSSGGTTAWYLPDRLGSVRDIASTSGTVIDHIVYDSYGNVLSESSPANGDRFKYTAREWDSIALLQYNRFRQYDARTGNFVSRDPASFDSRDVNLSRYVKNNPINSTDPDGLQQRGGGLGTIRGTDGRYYMKIGGKWYGRYPGQKSWFPIENPTGININFRPKPEEWGGPPAGPNDPVVPGRPDREEPKPADPAKIHPKPFPNPTLWLRGPYPTTPNNGSLYGLPPYSPWVPEGPAYPPFKAYKFVLPKIDINTGEYHFGGYFNNGDKK